MCSSDLVPTVTSLSPSTGPVTGGTTVTVTGTGFLSNATVTVGGTAVPGANVTVNSATSITIVTPATVTTGVANVQVTTTGGGVSSTAGTGDDFTYTATVPTITVLNPATGPTTGGTSVVITGTGFITGAVVKFGSLTASSVTINSPTQITAVSPATTATGTVNVSVTTSGGASTPAGMQGAAADDFL